MGCRCGCGTTTCLSRQTGESAVAASAQCQSSVIALLCIELWLLHCVPYVSGCCGIRHLLAGHSCSFSFTVFLSSSRALGHTLPLAHEPHRTALIEMIPDSLSIHTVKHRSPPGSTFSDHFFAKFVRGSPECVAAQRKLTESLAAYSLITYLLQVCFHGTGGYLTVDKDILAHVRSSHMRW